VRKVLINLDFPQNHVEKLQYMHPDFEFVVTRDKGKLSEHLKDAEVYITFFRFKKEFLDSAPNLKWVQGISAGVDALPLDEIRRRGILLTNGRGIHKIHMAEYAIGAMISLARNFHLMFRNQLKHKWDNKTVAQGEINGATVGILGLGSIGMEIARRASLFGMHVIGVKNNPKPMDYVEKVYKPCEMGEVFSQSDYIINLLPSTNETREVINKNYFDLMKSTSCFINMGRGTTVNEKDLVDALKDNKMRALVTDVYSEEPLPEDNPLWNLENVILTPHVCGMSTKYMDRAMEIIEHNMGVYASGQGTMMNVVDTERGY